MVERYDMDSYELYELPSTPDGEFVAYEDYQALEAENKRYREALEEIVEHGESDCYVIALHALEFNDVKNDVDKHRE